MQQVVEVVPSLDRLTVWRTVQIGRERERWFTALATMAARGMSSDHEYARGLIVRAPCGAFPANVDLFLLTTEKMGFTNNGISPTFAEVLAWGRAVHALIDTTETVEIGIAAHLAARGKESFIVGMRPQPSSCGKERVLCSEWRPAAKGGRLLSARTISPHEPIQPDDLICFGRPRKERVH